MIKNIMQIYSQLEPTDPFYPIILEEVSSLFGLSMVTHEAVAAMNEQSQTKLYEFLSQML